jgi:uncharacterized protein (TIGR03435 family)
MPASSCFIPLLIAGVLLAQPKVFEAASVKLPPGQDGFTSFRADGTDRFTATNTPLELLIEMAFGVDDTRISAGRWLGPERYDVVAKAEDGVRLTQEELQPRLRQLLEERFKLTLHRETKDVPGFALVVAKGGPKLRKRSGSLDPPIIYPGGLRSGDWSMESLAWGLSRPLRQPVVNETAIEGAFDIELTYTGDADTNSPLPSIFTALREQLGLRLEPRKVPVEILVIDHLEKVPTQN